MIKPKIGVYKFTSCDGCQLAFLNLGETLITLSEVCDFIHFAEFGYVAPQQAVDIAFIEGSVSTSEHLSRVHEIRQQAKFLITIGACATSGGIQALRNLNDVNEWCRAIYAQPEAIDTLRTSSPIAEHVNVDLELWGCPINSEQILTAMRSLLLQTKPSIQRNSVCMECKRRGYVCVMVSKQIPCMGPVTQMGCGALCPSLGRDCYGCYGPTEQPNTESFLQQLQQLGLSAAAIKRRFLFINNQAVAFAKTAAASEKINDHD